MTENKIKHLYEKMQSIKAINSMQTMIEDREVSERCIEINMSGVDGSAYLNEHVCFKENTQEFQEIVIWLKKLAVLYQEEIDNA